MDINGARALKERLGERAAEDKTRPAPSDVHEDAPPVYRWTGVSRRDSRADRDDTPADRGFRSFSDSV